MVTEESWGTLRVPLLQTSEALGVSSALDLGPSLGPSMYWGLPVLPTKHGAEGQGRAELMALEFIPFQVLSIVLTCPLHGLIMHGLTYLTTSTSQRKSQEPGGRV